MAEVQWTREQSQAIEGRGGDILVTAAAGSGKTAVLVERVVEAITREKAPVDADRLLVVTFSNAAAAEMKQRISRRVWELARENPEDRRLARQQILLESAQISTIHSFCISLLRSYFHQLGLPADFRIGEEQELNILRTRTLKEIIEAEYAKGEESFYDLVELLSNTRSDGGLERTILRLYDFIRNHPFYHEWLDRMEAQYDPCLPLDDTPWARILLDYAGDAMGYCARLLEETAGLMAEDEPMLAAYGGAFAADRAIVDACRRAVASGDWEECRGAFASAAFGPIGRLLKYPDEAKKKLVQSRRDEVKKLVTALREGPFALSRGDYAADTVRLRPMVSRLFGVVKAFDEALAAAKLERNLLDFGDLEHYSLALLYREADGKRVKSEIALQMSERFEEILVDEYQDTNDAQEMIFEALVRKGGNRFLVGDVKQSIYRFRQARPEIFLGKKDAFRPFDGEHFPAKIALQANFRTRVEITGVINYIFAMTMNHAVGEMAYGEEDRLEAKAAYPPSGGCAVRFQLLDLPNGMPRGEGLRAEARWVAKEIRRLLDSGQTVTGKSGPRPLEPGDICILLRSPRTRAEIFERELSALEVDCWADRQGGFLEAKEVAPVVSYLRILGNPLLDLELAKVLGSPLYGFTTDQMGDLRASGKKKSLFLALGEREGKDALCGRFWEDYRQLRRLAAVSSADQVVTELYRRTGAVNKARAMPQGESRQANLRLLAEYAALYRRNGGSGVDGFVSYLTALEEYGYDLPAASASGRDSVSIMSVHKSKGLEFPVVFFCDASAQFNTMDLTADTLLHPDLGFACILRDNRKLCQHKTLPYMAMAVENRRAMLSEELRILYVALTRARERLYITAGDKGLSKLAAAAGKPLKNGVLDPWVVRSAGSFYDWLAGALSHHRDFDPSFIEGPLFPRVSDRSEGRLQAAVFAPGGEQEDAGAPEAPRELPAPDEEEVRRLQDVLAWRYPYTGDTETPAKVSVSQLSKEGAGERELFARRPKALTHQRLTPAERGIAAHKFMQFADFAAASADPEGEIGRLYRLGFLSAEEAQYVDRQVIRRFFQSAVGGRILASPQVYREIRFLREFRPEELSRIDPAFQVSGATVVQGVADCVFLEGDRGVVVDYKTDRVRDLETLRQRYAGQLRLYKAILEDYLNVEIGEMILYSFALSQEIQVEDK